MKRYYYLEHASNVVLPPSSDVQSKRSVPTLAPAKSVDDDFKKVMENIFCNANESLPSKARLSSWQI